MPFEIAPDPRRYSGVVAKDRLTEAEAIEREKRMRAVGIKVVTDAPMTVTLMSKRVSTEETARRGEGRGRRDQVTQRPKRAGEIVPLPGIRRETTEDERDA